MSTEKQVFKNCGGGLAHCRINRVAGVAMPTHFARGEDCFPCLRQKRETPTLIQTGIRSSSRFIQFPDSQTYRDCVTVPSFSLRDYNRSRAQFHLRKSQPGSRELSSNRLVPQAIYSRA